MRWRVSGIVLALCGCGSDEEGGQQPPAEVPAATVCVDRCPTEPGEAERCEACFENIGRCCYPDDPDYDIHVTGLAFNCEATLGCSGCCDECAAMSCEDLRANGNCPFEPEPGTIANSLEGEGSALDCMLDLPLSDAGLAANAQLVETLAADVGSRQFVEYLISCALPEGQRVSLALDGETVSFEGGMGVAPDWAQGACDEACQEWVSACLLARINFYPVHVNLYMSGPDDVSGLSDPPAEGALKPTEEGAFYGNYFTDPPQVYACRGRGVDPYYRTVRLCTQPGSSCGIQVVGTCGDFDGATGQPSDRPACEAFDGEGFFYERCHNIAAAPGGQFGAESRVWTRVVTVHLPQSDFMEGEAACFEAP